MTYSSVIGFCTINRIQKQQIYFVFNKNVYSYWICKTIESNVFACNIHGQIALVFSTKLMGFCSDCMQHITLKADFCY